MNTRTPEILTPHGRIARRPLALWCRDLLGALDAIEEAEPTLEQICPIFNQAALIHFLRLDVGSALQVLDHQVKAIKELADRSSEDEVLESLLHVDVNLVRAHRHADQDAARSMLESLEARVVSVLSGMRSVNQVGTFGSMVTDVFIERCKFELAHVGEDSVQRCLGIAHHAASSTTSSRVAFEAAAILAIRAGRQGVLDGILRDPALDGQTKVLITLHLLRAEVASGRMLNAVQAINGLGEIASAAIKSPPSAFVDRLFLLAAMADLFDAIGYAHGARRLHSHIAAIAKEQRDLPFYLRGLERLRGRNAFPRDRSRTRFPVFPSESARRRSGIDEVTRRLLALGDREAFKRHQHTPRQVRSRRSTQLMEA